MICSVCHRGFFLGVASLEIRYFIVVRVGNVRFCPLLLYLISVFHHPNPLSPHLSLRQATI